MSHAGLQGGIQQGLSPFGLDELDLAREGWELWTYDRAGTGRSPVAEDASVSPGNPAHAEDWLALLTRVRERELPVVALSWSSGIIPVLTCARGGMQADALVDGEGPSDRRSIVPPRGPKAVEMGALDPWRDSNWADLEPARLLRYLQGPYARLQGVEDHVHGDMGRHAQKMWAAAMAAEIPIWPSSRLSGVLHGHPAEVLEAMSWARDRIEA
jgi:pimeloyl-ACP methyl ester carboxylesterase